MKKILIVLVSLFLIGCTYLAGQAAGTEQTRNNVQLELFDDSRNRFEGTLGSCSNLVDRKPGSQGDQDPSATVIRCLRLEWAGKNRETKTYSLLASNRNPSWEIQHVTVKDGGVVLADKDFTGQVCSSAKSRKQGACEVSFGMSKRSQLNVEVTSRLKPVAQCGNGVPESGEQCDDGNTVTEACAYGQASCMVCGASCQSVAGAATYCGDGKVQTGVEQCDDGNTASGDGCSSACTTEVVGPDLIVTNAEYRDSTGAKVTSGVEGGSYSKHFTIKNVGTARASYYGSINMRVFFTKDGVPDSSGGGAAGSMFLSGVYSLDPGQSSDASVSSGPVTAGTYCMDRIEVDPLNHVIESYEANNDDLPPVCITISGALPSPPQNQTNQSNTTSP